MASNFLSRLLLVRREKKLGKHHASGGSIMSQVPLNCELPSSFSGSVTLALFLSLGVFSLHSISSNFPGKISSALFFFFACVAVVPPSAGDVSRLCVYTGILKFQATRSLALQAHLASLCCVWTCILYSSGLPSMALLLYTSTLFAGRASLAGVVWKLGSIYYSKALFPMLF